MAVAAKGTNQEVAKAKLEALCAELSRAERAQYRPSSEIAEVQIRNVAQRADSAKSTTQLPAAKFLPVAECRGLTAPVSGFTTDRSVTTATPVILAATKARCRLLKASTGLHGSIS
jgi:hypothetical protein